jgi:60 kDa SS-A/Ro ribonucleoprotein
MYAYGHAQEGQAQLRAVHAGWQQPADMYGVPEAGPCRLPVEAETFTDEQDDLGAVILTVTGTSADSYDKLFAEVPQQGHGDTRVAVYSATYSALKRIVETLRSAPTAMDTDNGEEEADFERAGRWASEKKPRTLDIYEQLAADIRAVGDPRQFVLNFECCGCCSESGFSLGDAEHTTALWAAIAWAVERGSFVMASDFSLKALIQDWRPEVLGPNPFVQLGGSGRGGGMMSSLSGCNSSFELAFEPAELARCPSSQLQTVGELCVGGTCAVHAMGGTICYAVDDARAAAAREAGTDVRVLTVVTSVDGMKVVPAQHRGRLSSVGGSSGSGSSSSGARRVGLAGHVLLTLPGGGMLLTSMGHWVELAKLEVSEETLLAAARARGGEGAAASAYEQLSRVGRQEDPARQQLLQKLAGQMVMSATPGAQAGAAVAQTSAGGAAFVLDDGARLLRGLILGADQGTYYTSPQAHTADNLEALLRMLKGGRGMEAVELIRSVSLEGRAPRQTPTLTALAICCQLGDEQTRRAAMDSVGELCRTPTMLFEFLTHSQSAAASSERGSSGWGRALRRAVSGWYNGKALPRLAESVTKYQQRGGWRHRDALRLCHATPSSAGHAVLFRYCTKGLAEARQSAAEAAAAAAAAAAAGASVLEYLSAVEEAKALTVDQGGGAARCVELIDQFQLKREHVPSCLLGEPAVWRALLPKMPLGALVRSLAKLSAVGLLDDATEPAAVKAVCSKLRSRTLVQRARLHPLALLLAERTYAAGQGEKGSLTWTPSQAVCQALQKAFRLSFGAVGATGKNYCLALDISRSMAETPINGGGGGASLTCAEAASALALVTLASEGGEGGGSCQVMAFSDVFRPVALDAGMSLARVCQATRDLPVGGTDCSLPMRWAARELARAQVAATAAGQGMEEAVVAARSAAPDVFVVFTDSETWAGGGVAAPEALRRYRIAADKPDAKLVVVGMASNGFSVADPADPGMLDVVGMDPATPELISQFAGGAFDMRGVSAALPA